MSYPVYNQQQYMPQMVPAASCGAVSINIMNPTVGYTNPMTQQQYPNGIYQYPQASYYSQQPMQMPYPINYNNNVNNNSLNAVGDDKNQVPTPPAPNATNNEVKNTQEQKEPEKKEETKEKIPLTDDYIKSLENYLNSQDPKIRLMAAKDVLERFKEDSARKNDKALTALLNKTLQDPNSAVRFLALATLDAGYAKGDELTIKLLNNIKNDTQREHGEDSRLASQILLRLSAGDKDKFVPQDSQDVKTADSESKEVV